MMKSRIDKGRWYKCEKCGHKLFRLLNNPVAEVVSLEIKCHSCKQINALEIKGQISAF